MTPYAFYPAYILYVFAGAARELVAGEPDLPEPLPPHGHALQAAAEGAGGVPSPAAGEVHPDPREAHRHLHHGQSLPALLVDL
jgi:hypothetical protein